jgi:hypothetical protein
MAHSIDSNLGMAVYTQMMMSKLLSVAAGGPAAQRPESSSEFGYAMSEPDRKIRDRSDPLSGR